MKKNPFYFVFLMFSCLLLSASQGFAQFTFVHISDLHVCDNTFLGNTGNYDMNGESFQCTLDHINALNPKPAFVVASGDLSNVGMIGNDGMYNALTAHLFPPAVSNPGPGAYYIDAARTIPIYFIAGNHEYYQTIVPPVIKDSPEYYAEHIAPDADYYVNVNNALLIFIRTDGDRPITQDPDLASSVESKGITDAQVSWLRNVLRNAGNQRKIIVMHHPVVNAAGTNLDGSLASTPPRIEDGSFIHNRENFMNICDSNHVDIILAGHVHQNIVMNRAGNVVPNNWSNETRYLQTCAEYQGGYRVITVNLSSVNVNDHSRADATPANPGAISGATSVSQGQSPVVYTVPQIADASLYVWTLPTGATGSSTTNSITVNFTASAVSGNITVKGYNVCGGSFGTESSLAVTVVPRPAPINDNCVNFYYISTLPYTSSLLNNICATGDNISTGSACGDYNANVWYKVRGDGYLLEANTCNAGTNFNTEIHVYSGSCGALTEVACNDDDSDCGSGSSKTSWCSVSGTEYYISVGSNGSTPVYGNFVLNIKHVIPSGISALPSIIFSGQSSTLSVIGGPLAAGTSWKWYTGSCGGTPVPAQPAPPGTSYTTPGLQASTTYYVRAEGCAIPSDCASQIVELSATPACDFIYVSENGDDANSGSSTAPYKTIRIAFINATANSVTHIKIANGNYLETGILNIPDSTVIEGGYHVVNGIWTKSSVSSTNITCSGTEIINGDIAHVMGFKSDSSNNWKLMDLNIATVDAIWNTSSGRGKSNYAVWINNSSGYEIIRCAITAGAPSTGSRGATGTAGHTGTAGTQDGVPACGDGARSGGSAGSGNSNPWGNNGASGGVGGNSASAGGAASPGITGVDAPIGGKSGGAAGTAATNGGGQCGTYSTGGNGGDGQGWVVAVPSTDGIDGGTAPSTEIFGDYYTPSGQGATGGNGYPGAGGGGGGGARGQYGGMFPTCVANGGNSGSGGGQGGGGGEGGTGGWGSGGSFGIYQTSTADGSITDSKISSDPAVNGGTGGEGGNGGTGGAGPAGRDDCSDQRGTGGKGGDGGAGAKGGSGQTGAAGTIAQVYKAGTGAENIYNADVPVSPVISIAYNNMKICRNSVLTIDNNSGAGNWTLPANFEYVKYNQTSSLSQYSESSSPADIYPTNDATVGYYNLQAGTRVFPKYLDLESDERPLPVIVVTDTAGVPTDTIYEGRSVKTNANASIFGNILTHRWEIFNGTSAPDKTTYPDHTAVYYSDAANPTFGPFSNAGEYTVRYQVMESCCGWSIPVFSGLTVKPDHTSIAEVNVNTDVYYFNNNIYLASAHVFDANMFIYNVFGQEVLRTRDEGKALYRINVDGLSKGYYFVKIISENFTLCKKVYIDK